MLQRCPMHQLCCRSMRTTSDWSTTFIRRVGRIPPPHAVYHLVVLGAGTAGLVAAVGAAGLGARVAIVEKHLLGGDCLNSGCVPSKAVLRAARAFRELRGARPSSESVRRRTAATSRGRWSACDGCVPRSAPTTPPGGCATSASMSFSAKADSAARTRSKSPAGSSVSAGRWSPPEPAQRYRTSQDSPTSVS